MACQVRHTEKGIRRQLGARRASAARSQEEGGKTQGARPGELPKTKPKASVIRRLEGTRLGGAREGRLSRPRGGAQGGSRRRVEPRASGIGVPGSLALGGAPRRHGWTQRGKLMRLDPGRGPPVRGPILSGVWVRPWRIPCLVRAVAIPTADPHLELTGFQTLDPLSEVSLSKAPAV